MRGPVTNPWLSFWRRVFGKGLRQRSAHGIWLESAQNERNQSEPFSCTLQCLGAILQALSHLFKQRGEYVLLLHWLMTHADTG